MTAKEFRKIYSNTIKAPTTRKIINLARKLGLHDTSGNILTETGLSGNQSKEFIKGEFKMTELNKFYVYEGNRPVGIVENADQMPVNEIDKLARALKLCFDRDIHIRPIHPGDFEFDNLTGKKIDNITKFIYPEMEPKK